MTKDFNEMNLAELKNLAKENNIKNVSKLKKEELLEVLKQVFNEEVDIDNNDLDEEETTSGYKITNSDDTIAEGILDILPDGYGFLRGENYLSSPKDVYLSPVQIRRFKLDNGDIVKGISRFKEGEKFPSLIFVGEVNGEHPEKAAKRKKFDE